MSRRPHINRKGLSITRDMFCAITPLPDEYTLGVAVDDGGCFFDAMALVLNERQQVDLHSEKSLRALCHQYWLDNKLEVQQWNKKDYGGIDSCDDYGFVQYTKAELDKNFNGRAPIWGRSHIEGVMLCRALNIESLVVIELVNNPLGGSLVPGCMVITADKQGSLDVDEFVIDPVSHPCLVITQDDRHFVPVLLETTVEALTAAPLKDVRPAAPYAGAALHHRNVPTDDEDDSIFIDSDDGELMDEAMTLESFILSDDVILTDEEIEALRVETIRYCDVEMEKNEPKCHAKKHASDEAQKLGQGLRRPYECHTTFLGSLINWINDSFPALDSVAEAKRQYALLVRKFFDKQLKEAKAVIFQDSLIYPYSFSSNEVVISIESHAEKTTEVARCAAFLQEYSDFYLAELNHPDFSEIGQPRPIKPPKKSELNASTSAPQYNDYQVVKMLKLKMDEYADMSAVAETEEEKATKSRLADEFEALDLESKVMRKTQQFLESPLSNAFIRQYFRSRQGVDLLDTDNLCALYQLMRPYIGRSYGAHRIDRVAFLFLCLRKEHVMPACFFLFNKAAAVRSYELWIEELDAHLQAPGKSSCNVVSSLILEDDVEAFLLDFVRLFCDANFGELETLNGSAGDCQSQSFESLGLENNEEFHTIKDYVVRDLLDLLREFRAERIIDMSNFESAVNNMCELWGFVLKIKLPALSFVLDQTPKEIVNEASRLSLKQKDPRGDTILHVCLRRGDFDFAKALLYIGADPFALNAHDQVPMDLIPPEDCIDMNVAMKSRIDEAQQAAENSFRSDLSASSSSESSVFKGADAAPKKELTDEQRKMLNKVRELAASEVQAAFKKNHPLYQFREALTNVICAYHLDRFVALMRSQQPLFTQRTIERHFQPEVFPADPKEKQEQPQVDAEYRDSVLSYQNAINDRMAYDDNMISLLIHPSHLYRQPVSLQQHMDCVVMQADALFTPEGSLRKDVICEHAPAAGRAQDLTQLVLLHHAQKGWSVLWFEFPAFDAPAPKSEPHDAPSTSDVVEVQPLGPWFAHLNVVTNTLEVFSVAESVAGDCSAYFSTFLNADTLDDESFCDSGAKAMALIRLIFQEKAAAILEHNPSKGISAERTVELRYQEARNIVERIEMSMRTIDPRQARQYDYCAVIQLADLLQRLQRPNIDDVLALATDDVDIDLPVETMPTVGTSAELERVKEAIVRFETPVMITEEVSKTEKDGTKTISQVMKAHLSDENAGDHPAWLSELAFDATRRGDVVLLEVLLLNPRYADFEQSRFIRFEERRAELFKCFRVGNQVSTRYEPFLGDDDYKIALEQGYACHKSFVQLAGGKRSLLHFDAVDLQRHFSEQAPRLRSSGALRAPTLSHYPEGVTREAYADKYVTGRLNQIVYVYGLLRDTCDDLLQLLWSDRLVMMARKRELAQQLFDSGALSLPAHLIETLVQANLPVSLVNPMGHSLALEAVLYAHLHRPVYRMMMDNTGLASDLTEHVEYDALVAVSEAASELHRNLFQDPSSPNFGINHVLHYLVVLRHCELKIRDAFLYLGARDALGNNMLHDALDIEGCGSKELVRRFCELHAHRLLFEFNCDKQIPHDLLMKSVISSQAKDVFNRKPDFKTQAERLVGIRDYKSSQRSVAIVEKYIEDRQEDESRAALDHLWTSITRDSDFIWDQGSEFMRETLTAVYECRKLFDHQLSKVVMELTERVRRGEPCDLAELILILKRKWLLTRIFAHLGGSFFTFHHEFRKKNLFNVLKELKSIDPECFRVFEDMLEVGDNTGHRYDIRVESAISARTTFTVLYERAQRDAAAREASERKAEEETIAREASERRAEEEAAAREASERRAEEEAAAREASERRAEEEAAARQAEAAAREAAEKQSSAFYAGFAKLAAQQGTTVEALMGSVGMEVPGYTASTTDTQGATVVETTSRDGDDISVAVIFGDGGADITATESSGVMDAGLFPPPSDTNLGDVADAISPVNGDNLQEDASP